MRKIFGQAWIDGDIEVEAVDDLDPRTKGHARYDVLVSAYQSSQRILSVKFHVGNPGAITGDEDRVPNGVTNEALLHIVLDRLRAFQQGPLSCGENDHALVKVLEALLWLSHRSKDRKARGVEGTLKP